MVRRADAKEEEVVLVTPTIYRETEDSYYVDDEFVSAGDVVLKSDSASVYRVGQDVDSLVAE